MPEKMMSMKDDPYRPSFHIMPPKGWMNDPNGLCEFKGRYHVFFQYSPDDPKGGEKLWGHYSGKSLTELRFEGAPLKPDMPFDKNGVYSGSALVCGDELQLYYTGNVKQSGTHDFTYSGREANTVLVTSSDGVHFSEKKLLMGNDAYPPEYTCHVRDPKLWEEDGTVYMVQGGRINGAKIKPACPGEDRGGIIVFRRGAEDVDWPVQYSITTAEAFGYMWECPDYFCIGDIKILSCSPQGLPSLRFKWQNIYQSGYFIMPEGFDITDPLTLKECFGDYRLLENPEKCFREWDMGFDFYAPQTFEDSRGRRILIGWAGMPDADYDNRPTVERGWQHMMTLPRVISADGNVLRQWPAEEIESLRGDVRSTKEDLESLVLAGLNADVLIEGLSAERLSEMAGRGDDKDGYVTLIKLSDTKGELFKLSMERNDDEKGSYILHLLIAERAGRGRTERNAVISELSDVRMLIDASIVEIFINRGECVFTGRFYIDDDPAVQPFDLMLAPAGTRVWEMRKMKLEI